MAYSPITTRTTRRLFSKGELEARKARALERAAGMRYHATYLGIEEETGARVYSVRSVTRPADRYSVYASAGAHLGGHRYLRSLWWVWCTCASYREHDAPCRHAARVALRLEREHRAQLTAALRSVRPSGGELFEGEETDPEPTPPGGAAAMVAPAPERSLRLEDLFAA